MCSFSETLNVFRICKRRKKGPMIYGGHMLKRQSEIIVALRYIRYNKIWDITVEHVSGSDSGYKHLKNKIEFPNFEVPYKYFMYSSFASAYDAATTLICRNLERENFLDALENGENKFWKVNTFFIVYAQASGNQPSKLRAFGPDNCWKVICRIL